VRYMVVQASPRLQGRRLLLPSTVIEPPDWIEKVLPVSLTVAEVEASPEVDLREPLTRHRLTELHEYYGWPPSWTESRLRSTVPVGPSELQAAKAAQVGLEGKEPTTEPVVGGPHLRSTEEVVGYHVHGEDGAIGKLVDLLVDEEEWRIRYLLVDTGEWLSGRQVTLAPDWIESVSWLQSEISVASTRQEVSEAPEYDPSEQLEREYEADLYQHYGRPAYWA
jgi:hypothetical protein